MATTLLSRILSLFSKSRRSRRLILFFIFLFGVAPVVLMGADNYYATQRHSDEALYSSHKTIAHLAAVNLKEKFNHFEDLALSLADRPSLRKAVAQGNWNEAIDYVKNTSVTFPIIENVFFADPEGNYRGAAPELPGVIVGDNYAFRDWYKGAMATGRPYVSEIFKRAAVPHYQVFAISTPIKGDQGEITGILAMIIRLESVLQWTKDIDVGKSGFVYFVDKKGTVVGHPQYLYQDEMVDFSSVPVVAKVLKGESGVEITYNPIDQEERLSAYEPLPGYGWGVVAQQPTATAFESRRIELRQLIITSGLTIGFAALMIYFVLWLLNAMAIYRQRESIFLESVGDGLIAIDRSWNITLWNHASSVITGFSKEEAMGKPFREIVKFIFERTRKENIVFIENTMLKGKPQNMANHTVVIRKDGTEVPVADSASPIFDESGNVSGAIIIFRDASSEREVELNREEFMSLATHQLRTPVTAIKWCAGMLLEKGAEPLTAKQKDTLTEIRDANERMLTIVNAMLNVCRIEMGTLAVQPEALYLPDVADGVIGELEAEAKSKNLKIARKYAEGLPSVNADPKLTHAIFQNLLSNAIHYTHTGGAIECSISKDQYDFLIKITDNGCGIPKIQQSKIFSKLFRADNVIKEVPNGTGLGLYMIKRILDQTGGKIWFESEEDKGTVFFVKIPVEGMKRQEGTRGLS